MKRTYATFAQFFGLFRLENGSDCYRTVFGQRSSSTFLANDGPLSVIAAPN